MRKGLRRGRFDVYTRGLNDNAGSFGDRGMSSMTPEDYSSLLFFERLMDMKKIREFVFITKATAKNR
jgi:hypothetical protein